MNHVTLAGFVGQDPKVFKRETFTSAKMSIATKMFRNKETMTDWHDVEATGVHAEYIEKYVKKGDFVVVSGYLMTTIYNDKNNNERKNYGVKITSIESNNQARASSPQPTQAPQRQQQQSSNWDDDPLPY